MDALKITFRYVIACMTVLLAVMPVFAQEMVVSLLSPNDGEIASGENQRWTFQAQSGQVLSFRVETTSGDLDPVITIRNNAGMALIGNDDYDYPDKSDALLEAITIPRTGTYSITVAGVGESTGGYRLTMLPGYSQVERSENFNTDPNWQLIGETGILDAAEGQLSLAVEGRLETAVATAPDTVLPETYYLQAAVNAAGANGWVVGLTARQTTDSYYLLAINSSGQWRFSLHSVEGEHVIRDWTPHPAIVAGQGTFTLGMLVNGSGYDFFYDGQGFGRVVDSSLTDAGGIGLYVGTPDALAARAVSTFDDLTVTLPSEAGDGRILPQQLIVSTATDMVQELQRRGLVPAGGEMALTVNESFVESRMPGIEQLLLGRGATFQDFAMGATVTWQAQSGGLTGCGLVMRATDNENYTLAYIDQLGGYGVSQREGDSFEPGIFGENPSLTGNTHHLLIIARGEVITYYVDGIFSGTTENLPIEGAVGNAVVNFEPISTSCQYTSTWLWQWEEN